MHTEIILLIDGSEHVRQAVARSLAESGSYVEAVANCTEAIEFLNVFRPDWILVDEHHAHDLLIWMRGQEHRRHVPVVLLPDLKLPAPEPQPILRAPKVA